MWRSSLYVKGDNRENREPGNSCALQVLRGGSPSRRLLLRHAVQRAQAPDQLRAVDAHHFPIRELSGEDGQRRAIVWVVEGGRQHQSVGDVKVGVAGRQLPSVKP